MHPINKKIHLLLAGFTCFTILADAAVADGPFALVAGRRDPAVIVVDLGEALRPSNDGTANAVISRPRVTPDIDTNGDGVPDTPAAGLPSNVVISSDGRNVFAVNHAGNATPAQVAVFQHGWPGTVTVLDLDAVLDPGNDGSTNAIKAVIPTGGFGPVGLTFTQDRKFALVAHSEGDGNEDGAREITVVDLVSKQVVNTLTLALGNGGTIDQGPGRSCPELEANPTLIPHGFPDGDVGCFADSNGIGVSLRHGGFVFTANGGTDDVSVIHLRRMLAGDSDAEVARVATGVGPWGLAVSRGGNLVAVSNRESAETGVEGNTVSLIDVARAIAGGGNAAVAEVLVGTDDPTVSTRPFGLTFTPNGRKLVVANFRSNNVSVVDVRRALAGKSDAEAARIELTRPDSRPAQPRGVAVTRDGRFAIVAGGPRNVPEGGSLWLVDLKSATVAATVTGVGNEPYLLDITHGPAH
jgi:DNA-binding beta-propeller fold protein YncE